LAALAVDPMAAFAAKTDLPDPIEPFVILHPPVRLAASAVKAITSAFL
jgi:hypothetical protein